MTQPLPQPESLLELLYAALRSPYGLKVRTDNFNLLRNKLYAIRRQHKELSSLSLTSSPLEPDAVLWIMKNEQNPEEDTEPSGG